MKQCVIAAASLLAASLALAQPAPAPVARNADPKLELLSTDLRTISRITTLAKDLDRERDLLKIIVSGDVETLREPRGDDTYRWAALQRVEDGRVKDEKGIEKVSTEQILQTVTVTAPRAYRLMVTVPEKRSLLSANNKVYVRNVTIDSTGFDGKTTHTELPVNVWIVPKDSHGIALPDIARTATATVELGVETGTTKAVAEVALVQAKLVDDAKSPYFPAVQRLHQIEELVARRDIPRGDLRNLVDEAVLTLPGELERRSASQRSETEARKLAVVQGQGKGSIAVGDATVDVITRLSQVLQLSGGTPDQQSEARSMLQQLIQSLSPEPGVPARN